MPAKNIADNNAVQSEDTEKGNDIPRQGVSPKLEVVEGTVVDERTFKEKLKGVFNNKKVAAGTSAVVLIAVGVLVAKKRMNTDMVEDTTTES